MAPEYTKVWLLGAISQAKNLGFMDDVEHWTSELKKLEEK